MSDDTTTASPGNAGGDAEVVETEVKQKRRIPSLPSRPKRAEKTPAADAGEPDHAANREAAMANVKKLRGLLASLVLGVCAVFALVLALTVLFVAIDANGKNELVRFVVKFAGHVDLKYFSLMDPIKDFDKSKGPADDVKTDLFNYGICAVVWLVIGKVAESLLRPKK